MAEEEKKGAGENSNMKKEDVKEVFTRVLKKLKGK
tara:strand:- start:84 stop:188 length:105 start_codon:yes stop_codon:yes gene_type:complete